MKKNQPFTEADLRSFAFKLLSMREHSVLEMKQKLVKKLHEKKVTDLQLIQLINPLVEEMVQSGYISNDRFAEVYVYSKQDLYGNVKLIESLKQKGVSNEDIEKHLDKKNEYKRAARFLHRKFDKRPESYQENQKYLRFLYSRGFDSDTCMKALEYYKSEQWDIDLENNFQDENEGDSF